MKIIRTILVVLGTSALACTGPPMRISVEHKSVILDMQTLGEYPSNLARLRLTHVPTGKVVWEVIGHNGPQIGRVELRLGENPAQIGDVRHGTFHTVTPANAAPFMLEPDTRYVVEVWASNPESHRRRRFEFITPSG